MLKTAGAFAKRNLSPNARRAIRERWEALRDWIDVFAFGLRFMVTRSPRPDLLLYFGFAPGDDLLCTAALRELRKRRQRRPLIVSNHRELFVRNEDPAYLRPLWRRWSMDDLTVTICQRYARIWGAEFKRPHYAPLEGEDQSKPPSRHIIAEICADVGITGPVSIRPYLTLTDEERRQGEWARGKIVIQSSGMAARHPIRNKQWPQERFQGVVDGLYKEVEFVQLGSVTDPLLQQAKDLRGATSIRETAAILHNARLYFGTVGFLMHLARAVECPGVIVFGGREAPWQSGYVCNTNLYTAVPCAPCWRWNSCDFDRKCMTDISVSDAVSAIRDTMDRPRGPLSVEIVEIRADHLAQVSAPPGRAESAPGLASTPEVDSPRRYS